MTLSDGSKTPIFSFSTMSRQISDLDDAFDNSKLDNSEFGAFEKMSEKLNEYTKWAAENKDNSDEFVQQKIEMIRRLNKQYNDIVNSQNLATTTEYFDGEEGAARISMPKGVSGKAIAATSESEEIKEVAQSGFGKAFTGLGYARLAAKTAGIVINNGKSVIDMFGKQAIKNKEDKNIIAAMQVIIMNGEKSTNNKRSDTKFSVRFDISDMKWHATCIDNRKMKFPEDKLLNAVFKSEAGKKFKKYCLDLWSSIFRPKDKKNGIILSVLKNSNNYGFKVDKNVEQLIPTIEKMQENFDKIINEFK